MSDNPMRDAIQSAIDENPVILFMKGNPDQPACGFSARTVAVLQSLELNGHLAADDVRPRREELSQLDVRRAQSIDRPRETREAVAVAFGDHVGEGERQPQHRRQIGRVAANKRPFAREHESSVRQPQPMAERRQDRHNQIFQPEWIATIPPLRRVKSTRAKPASAIISANRSGDGNLRIDSTR